MQKIIHIIFDSFNTNVCQTEGPVSLHPNFLRIFF